MANYYRSEDLRMIADKLIQTEEKFEHLKDTGCRIAYQYSDQARKVHGKDVFADTEKVKDKFKQFIAYDFIVTFYTPNTGILDDEHMSRLMYHELSHIGYDPEENLFSIIPHDLEDFRDVIGKWGIDWVEA